MLQKIIIGNLGPFGRATLGMARLWGLQTGGQVGEVAREGRRRLARTYALAVDPISDRQCRLRNIRCSDGTIMVGTSDDPLLDMIRREGKPVLSFPDVHRTDVIASWIRTHRIRVLNVVGKDPWHRWWFCEAFSAVLKALGRNWQRPEELQRSGAAGVLSISGSTGIWALTSWPTVRGWFWHLPSGRWWNRAGYQRCALPDPDQSDNAFWWEPIPPLVRESLREVRSLRTMGVLEVLARGGKAAEDLLRSRSWALLYLISTPRLLSGDSRWSWDRKAKLLTMRRREVLGVLGFPASESAVRILQKLLPQMCNSRYLPQVQELLQDAEARRQLQGLPQINADVLRVLRDPTLRRITGWPLLREVAADRMDDGPCECWEPTWIDVIMNLFRAMTEEGLSFPFQPVTSGRGIAKLIEQLEGLLEEAHANPIRLPVLPGVPGIIEPLTDAAALRREGREMSHCVGGEVFVTALARGNCRIYRLLPDQFSAGVITRSTLELLVNRSTKAWTVGQLKSKGSGEVSPATRQLVDEWLRRAAVSPAVSPEELVGACQSVSPAGGRDAA